MQKRHLKLIDSSATRTAALLHVFAWEDARPQVEIADGILACRMDGTAVEQLYGHLCRANNLDAGEPHWYPSYFLAMGDRHTVGDCGPDTTIARLCNILAFRIGSPVPMCRFNYTPATEFIQRDDVSLTTENLEFLREAWPRDALARKHREYYGRYVLAAEYFFHAQRSLYLEQVCLNLGVSLNALAGTGSSPNLRRERVTEVASLLRGWETSRSRCDLLAQFFELHSRIVDGAPTGDSFHSIVPRTFRLVATLLAHSLESDDVLDRVCGLS